MDNVVILLVMLDTLNQILSEMFGYLFHRLRLNVLIPGVVVVEVVVEAVVGGGWGQILRVLLDRHHVGVGRGQERHGRAAAAWCQHRG